MTTDELKNEFKENILPKMPVMFNKARFKEKIVPIDCSQRQWRFCTSVKLGNSVQTLPFYKPIAKPHVTVK